MSIEKRQLLTAIRETLQHIKTVKSARVNGKKIKPDAWYMLRGGKFVEEASTE